MALFFVFRFLINPQKLNYLCKTDMIFMCITQINVLTLNHFHLNTQKQK